MSVLRDNSIGGLRSSALLSIALIFCAMSFAANAQQVIGGYTYTTVDCPPGQGGETGVNGINNFGTVVGETFGTSGFAFTAARQSDGTYTCTQLPNPSNGFGIIPDGINDSGVIVGEADSPDGSFNQGFILTPPYSPSAFTFFSHPGYTNTSGRAINNGGMIVGEANSPGVVAYVYSPATGFTDIPIPDPTATAIAWGINNAGQVVGEYRPSTGGVVGYSFDPATNQTTTITIGEFRHNGKDQTRVRGINDAGLMAGWGSDTSYPLSSPTFSFLGWVGNPVGPVGSPATTGYAITYPPTLIFLGSDGQSYGQMDLLGLNNSGQISGGLTNDVFVTLDGFVGTPANSTPTGSNVTVNAGTVGPAAISLQFPNITSSGVTTVTQIDPSFASSLPSGFALAGSSLAFEISTTATYTTPPPIVIAFQLASLDPATFANVQIFHNEGGSWVNVTASTPPPDPVTQTIYASVTSFSPFAVAIQLPTTTHQCKNNGWKGFGVFKNQGDCVSYVATRGKNLP